MAPSATSVLPIGREVRIEDRYELEEGVVLLSGVQALIRVPFDQMRADRRAGLRTGALVSGYPGSPLGGLDMELARQRALSLQVGLVHRPAINEELGATAVWGSQLVSTLPRARVDGVLGIWYGKAPGVDRAGDALRHGNYAGAHPQGGMLALCGDDPACKSSTVPSASETLLAAMRMPVLAPGTPQEALDLGLQAVALSRASGTWVAIKVATNLADSVGTVEVGPDRVVPVPVVVEDGGRPYVHVPNANIAPPHSLEMERTLAGPRLRLARAYARANRLNRVVVDPPTATIGLVAAGVTYYDMREALLTLGLHDEDLERLGVRILKLGMLWPMDTETVREFARGLDEIVVVEEKGPWLEIAIRDALYDQAERPLVVGKEDGAGAPLLNPHGALDADAIAAALAGRLSPLAGDAPSASPIEVIKRPTPLPLEGAPVRMPFFCSGCPHNRSTEVPEGANVGVGIGCSAMIALSPEGKGNITGVVQMGGEGSQWIGQEPFLEDAHLFQNLGDGTFHHSGSLAVRAAIASNVHITYKLLYNSAIAMTGGQEVEGGMTVPDLTRWLEVEGVRRIIVTAEEPERYRGVKLSSIAELRSRSELMRSQEELRALPGVTVLIHDQACAAEKRRLRKRGKLADPPERAFINERVCEGCGDCGQKSHCLSVLPVQTEFGDKTRIHQSSCNKDYSCLEGDCPSFLQVVPGIKAKRAIPAPPAGLPAPRAAVTGNEVTLRLIGIGGTGVVTVAQVLGMAAMLDGKRTLGLDQTGLAQKGGPVVSDVRIVPAGEDRANRAPAGGVDGYLGFDLLGATNPANLVSTDPERTVAVVSTSEVPTGNMIGDSSVRFSELSRSLEAIDRSTRAADNVYLDAQALAESLFGDHMPTNTLLVGAAWQLGLIPISVDAIREALRLNGAAIEMNLSAFEWGRAVVADPDLVAGLGATEAPASSLSTRDRAIVDSVGAAPDSRLRDLLEMRVPELVAYQGAGYAREYVSFVAEVLVADRAAGGTGAAAEAVARQLYKLMAYKDEYEVARLHLDPAERARIAAEFGDGAKVRYMLHPPMLRAMGMDRKIALGSWFDPAFRALRAARVVRGTRLDAFGYAKVRRVERELPGEYRRLVERALPRLASRYDTVIELCELPDLVRGYEQVKLRNVETYRRRCAELMRQLDESAVATPRQATP